MRGDSTAGRGVSEFTGVALLVGATVLVTASVGTLVLVEGTGSTGPQDANFSFQHVESSGVLIVTHDRGDAFDAGNLTVRSNDAEAAWWELAGTNETSPVAQGDTVQLSRNNEYGDSVNGNENVRVVYTPPSGDERILDRWDGI